MNLIFDLNVVYNIKPQFLNNNNKKNIVKLYFIVKYRYLIPICIFYSTITLRIEDRT